MMIRREQIVIKKLLVKFPQWGIACVDGVIGGLGRVVMSATGYAYALQLLAYSSTGSH